jgi:Zn-dependent protease
MFMSDTLPRSRWDWNFELLRIPVRVSAWFWLGVILLGWERARVDLTLLINWAVACFVSLLVHELGHALAFRRHGLRASITLTIFGGYAQAPVFALSTRARVLVALAGPAAGFVLAALVCSIQWALYGSGGGVSALFGVLPPLGWITSLTWLRSADLLATLFFINVWWGLINLLPVHPLDGGQVSAAVLRDRFGQRGWELCLRISLTTAILAVAGAVVFDQPYLAVMFALLGWMTYQQLQQLQSRGGY